MKDQYKHLMLWKKRNALKIDDDAQQDWLDMQAMLDEHMPVGKLPGGAAPYSAGFKLLSALFITVVAAAVMYLALTKGKSANHAPKKADKAVTVNNNSGTANTGNTNGAADHTNHNPDKQATNGTATQNSLPGEDAKTNAPSAINTSAVNGTNPAGNAKPDNKMPDHASHGNIPPSNGNNAVSSGNNPTGKTVVANNHAKLKHPGLVSTSKTGNHIQTMHGPLANGEAAVGTNERGGSGSRLSGHGFALSGRRASLLKGRHRRLTPGNGAIGKNGKGVKTGNSDYAPTGNNVLTDPYLTANHTRPDSDMVPTLQEPLMLTNIIDGLASFLAKRIKGDINDMMLTRQKQLQAKLDSVNAAAQKAKPSKATGTSAFDYGILTGINASGSFTSKNQNKNFYGSLPVDVFFGAFATYHFNDRWGVNLQLRGLNPQKISGTYTHSNDSKKDTNQVLVMADARKVYTADAALHLVYKPIAGLSLKAGPVFGYTLKEANGNTSFQTGPLKKDSVYYANVTKLINATTYAKTLTLGLSTGASYEYGRFIFDAAYVWNFKGPGAGSTLGSYSANNGSFLFSIGFKLNKPKK